MGVIDDLALSGVDRVERGLGKKAALRALIPLLDTLPAGGARARGLLRAIGYAAELSEDAQLESLCSRWIVEGGRAPDARRVIVRLLREGRARAASKLAEAEVLRTVGQYEEAAARYALGRSLEAVGRTGDALLEHETAAHLASEQPRLRSQASVRAMRALLALGRKGEAAARAARLLPLDRGEPEDRLAVAVIALDSPGRYRRAAALDVIELLSRERGPIGQAAARWAAWHAERAGLVLSDIEADRIEAILAPYGEHVAARLRALATMTLARAAGAIGGSSQAAHADPAAAAILPRARAVLEGHAAGPRPEAGRVLVGWLGVAACGALRNGDRSTARELLGELRERVRSGARLEAPVWTAAILALHDARMREAGRELAASLLARDGEPPPRGFVSLADALEVAESELATEAWRRAAARREPGARDRLARLLRHRGWMAADAGDRAAALSLLREARRLAGAD